MIVDWHAHVYPPELAKERRWGGPRRSPLKTCSRPTRKPASISASSATPSITSRTKPQDESLAFLRRWNEYGAEIQQKYSDRIVVFTSTLPCGGAPFVKELERAIVECGLQRRVDQLQPSRRLSR